jgi:hypothetical protein
MMYQLAIVCKVAGILRLRKVIIPAVLGTLSLLLEGVHGVAGCKGVSYS